MSEIISRRKFLKLTGMGAAAAAVLTGCGPAARYVVRRPYADMPEFNETGKSTYYATTCRECPAGCGLILRTQEGRALKAEGNPAHPVSRGKICSRGLVGVQGLYNPDRIKAPLKRAQRGAAGEAMEWEAGLGVVKAALSGPGDKVAFYLGLAPDHLFDLVSELTQKIGAPAPVRYGALGMLEGRATLAEASKQFFGEAAFPYFDLGGADLVVSFGADFLETWLSPVAYARGYSQMRRFSAGIKPRGYMVSLDARRSLTAGAADEWYPVVPGAEGLAALALGKLIADRMGKDVPAFAGVDPAASASAAGVPIDRLHRLAEMAVTAKRSIFIPGGSALAHANGLAAARAILALNVLVGSVGQPGGLFLTPSGPESSPANDVVKLIERMKAGQVETLFIHGANPLFELPPSLGFTQALANVKQVISFASFPDETALQADYVLPDHTPLEAWGYQRTLAGSDRPIVSAAQPVVVPLYNTRAAADVLLSAGMLPYSDEVDFIQKKLLPLLAEKDSTIEATEIATFWAKFLQLGGWWKQQSALTAPPESVSALLENALEVQAPAGKEYHLITYPNQMGDGSGANRPWLQETPSASTTVMWNSWVEINPLTAEKLGLKDDDIVTIKSAAGEVEAIVYQYPAIRPDTIAIPFGQGHTALGRWAEGRGCNPAALIPLVLNEAGDLAFGDTTITITPTGKRRQLARYESREGVYGEH